MTSELNDMTVDSTVWDTDLLSLRWEPKKPATNYRRSEHERRQSVAYLNNDETDQARLAVSLALFSMHRLPGLHS
jgi:hypothetical protein